MRIHELEGLRGLLAMWVFFSHIIAISGYEWASFRQPLQAVVTGSNAVDVFIILSGFVICMLLDGRRESYGRFVWRRFLRLYPIYFMCLLFAVALNLVGIMPSEWLRTQFLGQVVFHLIMLHGLVPE